MSTAAQTKKYATVARFGFGHGNKCAVVSLHDSKDGAIRKAKASVNSNNQHVLMALYSPDGFERGQEFYYDYLLRASVEVEVGPAPTFRRVRELGGCEVIF